MKGFQYIFGDAGKAALTGLLGVFCLAACHKDLPDGPAVPEDDAITVEFRLGSPEATRMTGATDADESNVDRWALFIFDSSGGRVGDATVVESSGSVSAAERSAIRTLQPGTYSVWAICNYPGSGNDAFTPSSFTTLSALQAKASALPSNAADKLVMSGGTSLTLSSGDGGTKYISVMRLVAKAGATKVTVNMAEDSWKAKTFVLNKMYLTNVCTVSRYGSDYASASDMDWTRNRWYNTMGYHTSGSGYFNGSEAVTGTSAAMDALTGDDSINAVIPANGGAYETAHTFYFYPNPVTAEQDTPSDTWGSNHRTRMVLECTLDGTTYYYSVSLPPSARNNSYIASDVTITRPGSTDPEVDEPGALTVTWETAADDWDGPYTVTENS